MVERPADGTPAPLATFRETLVGSVTPLREPLRLPLQDRERCSLIEDHLLVGRDRGRVLAAALEDLDIALRVDERGVGSSMPGVVRSGRLRVPGLVDAEITSGVFDLLGEVPGDGLRMRYHLDALAADGRRWSVAGTKLVVNEGRGSRVSRLWVETTTLFVSICEGSGVPVAVGTVRVPWAGFLRQLASLHGEAGPDGGLGALLRLGRYFGARLAQQYGPAGAGSGHPGGDDIESAFAASSPPDPD